MDRIGLERPPHPALSPDALRRSHNLTPQSIRRPRASGDPAWRLRRQIVGEVSPRRILTLNRLELPRTPPSLDPLFAQDRVGDGGVELHEYERANAVAPREAGDSIRAGIRDAASKIGGDADIERSVTPTREDIDARALVRHATADHWVPACAGTTVCPPP